MGWSPVEGDKCWKRQPHGLVYLQEHAFRHGRKPPEDPVPQASEPVAEGKSSRHALKRGNYLKGPDANTQALHAEGFRRLAEVWPERFKALLPVCRRRDHKSRKAEMALRC